MDECVSGYCLLVAELEEMRVESHMKGNGGRSMWLHLTGLIGVTAG